MSHRPFASKLLALASSMLLSPPALAASEAPARGPKPGAAAPERPRASAIRVRLVDGREVALSDERLAKEPVARVDGVPITMRELREAAAEAHPSRPDGKQGPIAHMDVNMVLDRIIGLRLIAAEAHAMGLDELEEVKAAIQQNRDAVRFDMVRARAVKGVKVDRAEVEKRYAEAAKEWKLRSVLFTGKEDAVGFGAAVEGGGDYEALVAKALADKKASKAEADRWIRASEVVQEVAKAVSAITPGHETAPLQVKEGWTVVRLDAVRTARDPKLRGQIEATVRNEQLKKVLQEYYDGLKKKQVQIDEAVLKAVDFDSTPFETSLKDTRVVARVTGDPKPVTIAELADELVRPLFHGVESAQREKRVDKQKGAALDAIVSRRLVVIETAKHRLDELPEARRNYREFASNLVFSTFVERVILPDVAVTDEALKAAYEKRRKALTYPAFYRLEGLTFADPQKAQAALKSLQSGTDFRWLKGNAETVPPAKGAPTFDGATVSANQLPEELRKALTGAKEGDARLYAAAGQHFVVRVASFTPEHTQSFEQARPDLEKTVHAETLARKLDEFVAKLRKAHDVKVYVASAK